MTSCQVYVSPNSYMFDFMIFMVCHLPSWCNCDRYAQKEHTSSEILMSLLSLIG